MQEFAKEVTKFGFNIVALQEIRCKGQGEIRKKDFTLYYSGNEQKSGQKGTGFIITGTACKSVLGFQRISDRICKIRIKGKLRNITMISAYAPTEDAGDKEKEAFYDEMSKTIEETLNYDMIVLLGDFNAKIGKEDFIKRIAGSFSLHDKTNENGQSLGQMAESHQFVIKSTAFNHKNIHKGTWRKPGSDQMSQIDHVLVSARHASSVIDVRACRGPNCDSDHMLLKVIIREKISNAQKKNNQWKEKSGA